MTNPPDRATDLASPSPTTEAEPTLAVSQVDADRQLLVDARQRGPFQLLGAFVKLSGPGWLQSAITLGGGSLAGSLYLGVLAGYDMMWWQPMAMILGVIMLSAIGYVTLSTGERPFQAIRQHVNPVLAWGWVIATIMANMVWCMPQFGLGTASLRQNLFPGLVGEASGLSPFSGELACVIGLFLIAFTVIWCYDSGGWGIKLFEGILKAMVGVVVLCFFGVVVKLSLSGNGLEWAAILNGFIPRPHLFFTPAEGYSEILAQAGPAAEYWSTQIVNMQQQVMITAAATAVGINMTFLLPYSMLARGWDKEFRGLAIFDLGTALFIPYLLATSCVVIAAINQFHVQPAPGLVDGTTVASPNLVNGYKDILNKRLIAIEGKDAFEALPAENQAAAREALPQAEKELAAMLVQRDAFDLANSLSALVGSGTAQYVFGIGVLGMALSTIIILMLINGFAISEIFNLPNEGTPRRIGALIAGLSGALGPFVFKGDAKFWLTVPTSMFGMVLLPIAYFTFFALFNSRSLMGDLRPKGLKLIIWNILMLIAATIATMLCLWTIAISNAPVFGFTALGVFILLAVIVHFLRTPSPSSSTQT